MDGDRTLTFIARLEEKRLLWDKEHPDFLNRDKKKRAFELLAQENLLTVLDCKKKLKSLKDRMRVLCSQLPRTKSGQPAYEKGQLTIRWPYFRPLLFMQGQFSSRSMIGHMGTPAAYLSKMEPMSDDSDDDDDSGSTASSAPAVNTQDDSPQERYAAPPFPKRQRFEQGYNVSAEKERIESMLRSALQPAEKEEDEWESFATSLCCDLRKLRDPLLAMRVKADIMKLVNEAVVEQIALDRTSQPHGHQQHVT